MNRNAVVVALIASVAGTACSDRATRDEMVVATDSAGVVVIENALSERTPICPVAPSPALVIGQQDGPPEYQLYRTFGARRLSNGNIAIANQGTQELRLYDSEGRFLKAAGGEGAGPGRFKDAFTMAVLPGDSIWVGDYDPWEWEVFSPDGTWIRGVRPVPDLVNANLAEVLHSGMLVTAPSVWAEAPVGSFSSGVLTVLLHSPDGALIDTVGTFDSGRYGKFEDVPGFVASPMFDSSSRISAGGTRIVTGHTSRAELRVIEVGSDLRLDRIIRWDVPSREVTPADVDAERSRILERNAEVPEALRQTLVGPQIREDRPVAETFPVFSQIEIGRDGRIWVRTYQPPTSSDAREWLVFAADGALQCRVDFVDFEQLPDFGSDYMLVMKRDEMGVEQIFLHELGGPRAAEGV